MKMKMMIDWGKVLTSWTLWANVILGLITVGDYLASHASDFPQIPLQYIALGLVVLNFILRFKTNDALIYKMPKQ